MALPILAIVGGAVGVAASVATGVATAVAQSEQMDYNRDLAEYQAKIAANNAAAAQNKANAEAAAQRSQTDAETAVIRRRNQAILAQNRAELGGSGLNPSGSLLALAIDNAENAELEARENLRAGRYREDLIRYDGEMTAYNYRQQEKAYEAQADYYAKQKTASWLNFGIMTPLSAFSAGVSGAASGLSMESSLASLEQARTATRNTAGSGLLNPSASYGFGRIQ